MLADLPQSLQEQVIYYLEANDFKAAKELHDQWLFPHPANEQDYNAA